MDNEKGYSQAIENIAYEIDQMAINLENANSDLATTVTSLISHGDAYELIQDNAKIIDNIIALVVKTYNKTLEEVEKDIDILLGEIVIKHIYK